MNLKTGIMLILFAVALGGVIVGQRLQVRSLAFEAGQIERDLTQAEKENLVLRVEYARRADPQEMLRRVREAGMNLLPPEHIDGPSNPARRG